MKFRVSIAIFKIFAKLVLGQFKCGGGDDQLGNGGDGLWC